MGSYCKKSPIFEILAILGLFVSDYHPERAVFFMLSIRVIVQIMWAKIIKEKMSPYAVAELIKQEAFEVTKSYKTIYNYIDEGFFPNLTNKHLPVKKDGKKRNYDEIRTATNNHKGTSISERPKETEQRNEYGHREMDTVVGEKGTKEVLLVLTERKTNQEIIRKISNK